MRKRILTILDIAELYELAAEIITDLSFQYYRYDEDGNDVIGGISAKERKRLVQAAADAPPNYLNFAENEELQAFTPCEALLLTIDDVKNHYLKELLPMLRGVMRKDPRVRFERIVSAHVPDEYLDDLLAVVWRNELEFWSVYRKTS